MTELAGSWQPHEFSEILSDLGPFAIDRGWDLVLLQEAVLHVLGVDVSFFPQELSYTCRSVDYN